MSRYYGHALIEFMDGSNERVGGNRAVVDDGVLIVKTESDYGGPSTNVHWYPLGNIRSWRWEGER